jgi:hypothetical protein
MGIALSRFLRLASKPRSRGIGCIADKQGSLGASSSVHSAGNRSSEINDDILSTSPTSPVSPVFSTCATTHPISSSHSSVDSRPHTNSGSLRNAPVTTDGFLNPFQCTFCLSQCMCRQGWKQHERTQHFPQLAFDKEERAYWNCGFCPYLSKSWDERMEHIGDHYEEGMTMSSWDSRSPPSPLHRGHLAPLRELRLDWDAAALLSLQRLPSTIKRQVVLGRIHLSGGI